MWLLLWLVWSLTLWYQVVWWLPARKKITECTHSHGKVRECNPDFLGKPTSLVWFCSKCSLQMPMGLVRGPLLRNEHHTWILPPDYTKEQENGKTRS